MDFVQRENGSRGWVQNVVNSWTDEGQETMAVNLQATNFALLICAHDSGPKLNPFFYQDWYVHWSIWIAFSFE